MIFSFWSYEPLDSEASSPVFVLRADYSVEYFSDDHQRHAAFATAAGAAYALAVPKSSIDHVHIFKDGSKTGSLSLK